MGALKNLLLTGATGYLGSHLAKALVSNGYNVYILKRKSSSLKRLNDILDKVVLLNIEDVDLEDFFACSEIDAIIHSATSYGRKGESLSDVYAANMMFPLQLLEYALKYNVKYFLNSNTTLPVDLNIYALSKGNFSQVLNMYSNLINVVNIELQYFYGPKDDNSKFVTLMLTKMAQGEPAIDLSEGTQIRDFIYISDVVDAYITILKNTNTLKGYNTLPLGSGNGISLKELTEKIKFSITNNTTELRFGALPMRTGEVMHSVADISFLQSLGWRPNYSIDEGLIETIKQENNFND
jgi:CDP-paratose synthetase